MSKRVCWSWRYMIRIGPLDRVRYRRLYDACREIFGSDQFHSLNRWEITTVPRGNYYLGERWYSRIALHFKSKEDFVFFKLAYNCD